jgi:hypothetical protein
MNTFIPNDRGDITYAPKQRIVGPEYRSRLLGDVRALADATAELCQALRNFWPGRYPVPEDVNIALLAADYGMSRVRGGALRRLAELDTGLPAAACGHYIGTDDLALLADIKAEIIEYFDSSVRRNLPQQQEHLRRMADGLGRIIEAGENRKAA